MAYLSDDFLLHTPAARKLFHEYAETAPIYDYHCHLSPADIAADAHFENISRMWLSGDHYKWRAMRANGIDERFITGNASDEEKFAAWARTMPLLVRNPLFDWAHLELRRYFGITNLLSPENASSIYNACNERIGEKAFSVQNLLRKMKVKVVCTTDDPIDDLSAHERLRAQKTELLMRPTFRPDKAMSIDNLAAWNHYIDKLAEVSDTEIASFDSFLIAIDKRHAYFHEHNCRSSDHAFERVPSELPTTAECGRIFMKARAGSAPTPPETDSFKAGLLLELCRMSHHRGWVQQFHFGIIRNVRSRVFAALGSDSGVDCIGDVTLAWPLALLLDALDNSGKLTRTVLFNGNPSDNELIVCMTGAFQDGSFPCKVQFGPAWWFLDHKNGITRHIEALSGLGLLARFVGMTTDSRSFLSFPRHEYFRRILCNTVGADIENGDCPDDRELIGPMVRNVCCGNAKSYFGF
jgi:glucuronate isomerase